MDKTKLWIISLFFVCSLFSDLKKDLQFDKDWTYQDILVNGQLIMKGSSMDCPSRYEALKPILDKFERPFTVLDLGANNGYFSLKIAEDYNAVCVLVDGTDRLKKICELNTQISSLVYLQKYMHPIDIEYLAEHEHFDVVLCFHLLHHVDFNRFIPALFKLGDHVIIETPPVNDGFVHLVPAIPILANYLTSLPNGVQIGSFQRPFPGIKDHMLLFSQPLKTNMIYRDFKRAEFFNNKTRRWENIPSKISAKTYNRLNGVYHSQGTLDETN